jgi:hypothetical protein
MYVSKSMTFPTPHVGHSRHGLFFTRLDCQSNAKPFEKDMTYPGFKPVTFGAAISTTPFRSSGLSPTFSNYNLY